jgi:uncharacterized protein DUF6165
MVDILAPISVGELIDKLTILRIRLEKIADAASRHNIQHEFDRLDRIRGESALEAGGLAPLEEELLRINRQLWQVEDDLREHERLRDFGARFVELARLVYRLNDRRSAAKKRINELTGSAIVEEKSYSAYE